MAYAFIDIIDVTDTANGLTLTQSRTYGAGERVLIWLRWITVGGVTPSVSDGTNTYTQIGTTLVDANTSGSYAVFECKNTASGTVTVTFTLTSPGASFRTMLIARYSGLDTTSSGAQNRAAQASPGTGTDALSSGNVTVASQPALLFGISYDDSGANAITAGTGFTSRGTCANQDAAFGTASRIEDKRLTSTTAVPATFTASGGTDNYVTFGIVVPESAAAAASLVFKSPMSRIMPLMGL